MNAFLFLFPAQIYIELLIANKWINSVGMEQTVLRRLNEIIDKRYRQKDYRIFWLMFCLDEIARDKPNTTGICPAVKISPKDQIISCGVTQDETIVDREDLRPSIRFDPANVIAQLPTTVADLKIGGYHQWDCVNRMAQATHEQGLPTLVDEDTTDFYFSKISRGIEIPDHHDYTIRDFGLENLPTHLLNHAIRLRAGRPWFAQD